MVLQRTRGGNLVSTDALDEMFHKIQKFKRTHEFLSSYGRLLYASLFVHEFFSGRPMVVPPILRRLWPLRGRAMASHTAIVLPTQRRQALTRLRRSRRAHARTCGCGDGRLREDEGGVQPSQSRFMN